MTTYYSKLPRNEFKGWGRRNWRSLLKAQEAIERCNRPGYTSEPYIQLIGVSGQQHSVISEYMPGKGWTDPLTAAGFFKA